MKYSGDGNKQKFGAHGIASYSKYQIQDKGNAHLVVGTEHYHVWLHAVNSF